MDFLRFSMRSLDEGLVTLWFFIGFWLTGFPSSEWPFLLFLCTVPFVYRFFITVIRIFFTGYRCCSAIFDSETHFLSSILLFLMLAVCWGTWALPSDIFLLRIFVINLWLDVWVRCSKVIIFKWFCWEESTLWWFVCVWLALLSAFFWVCMW